MYIFRFPKCIQFIFLFIVVLMNAGYANATQLSISPINQEYPEWCWLSVGQMVFEYYGVPAVNPIDYQCGIVAYVSPACNANCGWCGKVSAGNADVLSNMLKKYPQYANAYFYNLSGNIEWNGYLITTVIDGALSPSEVKEEIEAGNPIVAGITPLGFPASSGQPSHAVLIVGYELDSKKRMTITINDPFPYGKSQFGNTPNPYMTNLAKGSSTDSELQYEIGYDQFKSIMKWQKTITIKCNGKDCSN